jgi:CRISP-associated protein Cas1
MGDFADESMTLPEWMGEEPEESATSIAEARTAVAEAIRRMKVALNAAERATSLDALRGHEGDAAAEYFRAFPKILPRDWKDDFAGRSRRPPRDRVNALLGFAYALLVRDAVAALARIGLDPMLGLYHTMIPGRPAAALDLMEPFRAAWSDAAVVRLIATHGVSREDFHLSAAGVFLSAAGRRAMIRAHERRADELTTHPRFGYRMSYRRLLELEARVFGKWLLGEVDSFTPMWTR